MSGAPQMQDLASVKKRDLDTSTEEPGVPHTDIAPGTQGLS